MLVTHASGNTSGEYPSAPLPAHERLWRHPSEVGAEAWRRTEPPLSIGRGLVLVTSACCVALGAALTWATLNTHPGHLSPAAASPIAAGASAGSTTAPDHQTPPTYRVEDGTVRPEPAIGVPLSGGRVILTTANAVRGQHSLELRDSAGRSEQARVVLVDDPSGIAVLVTDTNAIPLAFEIATALDAGDELRFADDSVVVVHGESIAATRWYGLHTHEGSPVINQRGELVGLCSLSEHGVRVLLLEQVGEILRRLGRG